MALSKDFRRKSSKLGAGLSDEGESICINIGVYMAMVFLHQNEALAWHFDLERKKSLDYRQSTIGPLRLNYMNTIEISKVIFLQMIDKREDKNGLYKALWNMERRFMKNYLTIVCLMYLGMSFFIENVDLGCLSFLKMKKRRT